MKVIVFNTIVGIVHLFFFVTYTDNPLCTTSPPTVPKQKKALPPLPPPKPISEERRKREEDRIYEELSDEEDGDEYIAPTSMGPLDMDDEGGILEYHYPSVDRRIRPASFQDDGAPVTSSSGGGMFDHDEEDDDEYIDPTIPAASMKQIQQAPDGGHGYMNTNSASDDGRGYMNTNTLDGRDLKPTKNAPKNVPKSFTLPNRSPSMREKSSTHPVTVRNPLTPPSSRKKIPIQPLPEKGGPSNELFDALKKRKNKVEEVGDDDSVFERTRHTSPPQVHSKPFYQV